MACLRKAWNKLTIIALLQEIITIVVILFFLASFYFFRWEIFLRWGKTEDRISSSPDAAHLGMTLGQVMTGSRPHRKLFSQLDDHAFQVVRQALELLVRGLEEMGTSPGQQAQRPPAVVGVSHHPVGGA